MVQSFGGRQGSRVERILSIIGDAAELVIRLRDKPRPLDWIALGLRGIDVAARIRGEFRHDDGKVTRHYQSWLTVPVLFRGRVPKYAEDRKVVFNDGAGGHITEGRIGTARVAWMGLEQDTHVAWVRPDDLAELLRAMHDLEWAAIGSSHAVLTPLGFAPDPAPDPKLWPTGLVTLLEDRIAKFRAIGEVRSYLVIGEPGCGKTTAVRHAARVEGLRVLRIPLKELSGGLGDRPAGGADSVPFELAVGILAPDVLVVDDVDRAPPAVQNALLEFMEMARGAVKILLATANHPERMLDALQRPERFDHHVQTPPLEPGLLREILGGEADIAEQLAGWPIVYVLEYLTRVRGLGREQARAELGELSARIASARAGAAGAGLGGARRPVFSSMHALVE